MAVDGVSETLQIYRIPQSKYIDAVRWLPPLSALDRFVVLALCDSDYGTNSIEIQTLNRSNPSILTPQSSFTLPSRVSSLRVSQTLHKPLIAASTISGHLNFLFANSMDASLDSLLSLPENQLHVGPISGIDLQENGSDCVSVGEDGRVNLVSLGDSSGLKENYRKVYDSKGLVSFTAVKWASHAEFATGGLGFSLQWWDLRRSEPLVCHFKGNW